jgi:hypothetical protein
MTTECEALRAEVVLLADENRRLLNEILELRKIPAYPEAAVRAVWEHGAATAGFEHPEYLYVVNDEEVSRIFTKALKHGN